MYIELYYCLESKNLLYYNLNIINQNSSNNK